MTLPPDFHRLVLENLKVAVWVIDEDERTTWSNEATTRLLGWLPEEMLGKRIYEFMDPTWHALAHTHVERRKDGQAETHDFGLLHRSGRRVMVEAATHPLYDGDRYVGATAVMRELEDTLGIGNRADLVQRLAVATAVFDRSPVGIQVYDKNGDSTSINQAMLELLGLDQRPLVAEPFNCLTSPVAELTGLARLFRRAYQGEMVSEELMFDFSAGWATVPSPKKSWFDITIFPIRGDGAEVMAVAGFCRDVTDRKGMEQSQADRQRLESLGVMAGGIAHDFNNLLVGILGNAELALREIAEGSPGRRELEAVQLAARRAGELTQQLLAYAGKSTSEPEIVDVSEVIEESLELLRLSMSRSAAFTLDLCDKPLKVKVDPGQLRQIVMNLVVNASESLGPSGGQVVLRTRLLEADDSAEFEGWQGATLEPSDHAVIEVTDSGRGMDEATVLRAFEPFFSTKGAGRGLGLATALGIARSQGGGLSVTTAPEKGTTFRVAVPLWPEGAEAPGPAEQSDEAGPAGLALVVDDEPDVREVLVRMLELEGWRCDAADCGEAALEQFRPGQYRLVLLDLTMPGMGGAAAFEVLRKADPDVAILVCSGYSADLARLPMETDPRSRYLAKPFTLARLREAVGALTRG